MEKILVHRINADPIELDREQCHFVSRSEIITGQTCPEKRWLSYKFGGRGVESARTPSDLTLGSAVHWGLERMLTSEVEDINLLAEIGAEAAKAQYIEDSSDGLDHGNDYVFDQTPPEVSQLLGEEQANLAYALVWAFGKRRLASLLERYEIVEVEPEINWLIDSVTDRKGEFGGGSSTRHIVMMSRPDAILRSKEDGKLWTVSWKTAKRFTTDYLDRLECDVQSITEGLAVQAKYGEEPGGTFYSYLLKSDKANDDATGAKRYTSPLIRPYSNWTGVGEPQYRAAYKWFDESGAEKRLGKGWARTDIWKGMELNEWLELLDSGVIQPEAHRDWLGEVVAEPLPMPFKAEAAKRWLEVTAREEARWIEPELPAEQRTGNCLNYNRRCSFWAVCHEGDTIERRLAAGLVRIRVGNHEAEIQQEGE
jgi:hypothetical protein